eukprot:1160762-Pelagomonas_calceolata.AAC.3
MRYVPKCMLAPLLNLVGRARKRRAQIIAHSEAHKKRIEKKNYAASENTYHIKERGYLGPRHRVSPSHRETEERVQWGSGGLAAPLRLNPSA